MANTEKIQLYLEHRMSAEEEKQFKQEILQDAELAQEVELQRIANLSIERLGARSLKEKMQMWEESISKDVPLDSKPKIPAFWIALFIALFLASLIWFFINSKEPVKQTEKPTNAELFAKYYGGDEKNVVRSARQDVKYPSAYYLSVVEALSNEEYEKVIQLAEQVQATDSIYLDVKVMELEALISAKKEQAAQGLIRELRADSQLQEHDMARDHIDWSECCLHLLQNDLAATIACLQKIEEDPVHVYSAKAKALLKELD